MICEEARQKRGKKGKMLPGLVVRALQAEATDVDDEETPPLLQKHGPRMMSHSLLWIIRKLEIMTMIPVRMRLLL